MENNSQILKNIIYIRSLLFLFSFLVCSDIFSQVYKAGTQFSYYYDINPDTLINYVPGYNVGNQEDYYFDINGDSQNDFDLEAYSYDLMPVGSNFILIKSLNANSFLRVGRWDSVYNNYQSYWWVSRVAQPLNYGDTINLASAWQGNNSSATMLDQSYSTGASKNITDWISTNDLYIGVKYQTATDTIYGWIRVNCPNVPYKNQCYVKDYSYGRINNKIDELKDDLSISIWPNPVNQKINIQSSSELETIIIYNTLGKIVFQILSKNKTEQLDVTDLANGIYFIRVKTNEGTTTKKIVIQH